MKSLAKKLVIASGLVAVLGGCTATQNGRGGNETLLGLSLMSLGIQKNNPAAAAVGRGLLNYGAAKAGRSEVNINVYGGGAGGIAEFIRSPQFAREFKQAVNDGTYS